MNCLKKLLFFHIPFLYYYTNLNSSMICCLFSGDKYFSFGTVMSLLVSLFCECNAFDRTSPECNFFGDFEALC